MPSGHLHYKSWKIRADVPTYLELFRGFMCGKAEEIVEDCPREIQPEASRRLDEIKALIPKRGTSISKDEAAVLTGKIMTLCFPEEARRNTQRDMLTLIRKKYVVGSRVVRH